MASKVVSAIIGAAIAILTATGLIEAEDGTTVAGYALQAATGILGLVEVVRGILRKGKADGQ